MGRITWITEKGAGANFKVGDRIDAHGIFLNYNAKSQRKMSPSRGTIKAVEKGFQENIDAGCPFYYVKVKFDNRSDIVSTHTQPLKKINSKTE